MSSQLYHTCVMMLTTLIAYCTCASLGTNSLVSGHPSGFTGFGQTPSSFQAWQEWAKKRNLKLGGRFGTPMSPTGGFQSWQEWAKKRSLGSGSFSPLGNTLSSGNFQDWREWMNKRGFHVPDSFLGQEQFQQWSDWAKKRSLMGEQEGPFSGQNKFNKLGNYQDWSEWLEKRSGGLQPFKVGNPNVFGMSPSRMQSWDEFMKRQGLGLAPGLSSMTPAASSNGGLGHHGVGLQSWQEWAKRDGSSGPIITTGGRWGDFGLDNFSGFSGKDQMMDWAALTKDRWNKRQLGSAPQNFGNFHRYFTNGLQDWRSTFHGDKRDDSEINAEDESNTSKANKQDKAEE